MNCTAQFLHQIKRNNGGGNRAAANKLCFQFPRHRRLRIAALFCMHSRESNSHGKIVKCSMCLNTFVANVLSISDPPQVHNPRRIFELVVKHDWRIKSHSEVRDDQCLVVASIRFGLVTPVPQTGFRHAPHQQLCESVAA